VHISAKPYMPIYALLYKGFQPRCKGIDWHKLAGDRHKMDTRFEQ